MCTAFTLFNNHLYFGRNMDLDYSFNECVVITPRNYSFLLKNGKKIKNIYAMLGMATVINDYPLYAEAINEKGLCLAGLNFPQNAYYSKKTELDENSIAPFELFPFLLGQCENIMQIKDILNKIEIVDVPFSSNLANAPLHWMVCDKNNNCLVIECSKDGMKVYDNPLGILTNNPPFPYHLENIRQYLHLSSINPKAIEKNGYILDNFCEGAGGLGIPGDFTSPSRFSKVFFAKKFSVCEDDEMSYVTQAFHILDSVAMIKGCVVTENNKNEITRYSCVMCFSDSASYYYKTYNNNQISVINLTNERMSNNKLSIFKISTKQQYFIY